MNQASKTKLRSTLAALIAALVMFGPDILEALNAIDAAPKWVKLLTKGFGLVLGLVTSGKAVALLNKFLPDDNAKPAGPVPPVAAVLALLAGIGLLGYSVPARADINLDDIAPKLTKCWGTTCLQPAASVNAVMFDLGAKKWLAGTTALGAGLELLFYADQPYGFGPIAHLSGVIAQQGPSFALITGGLVVARYGEIGYSRRLSSDEPSAGFLSVALTFPWDVLASGKALPTRAAEVRAAQRAAAEWPDHTADNLPACPADGKATGTCRGPDGLSWSACAWNAAVARGVQ